MQKNTLITLLDSHNESGIILFKKYKFKNIKIVIKNNLEQEKLLKLKSVYESYNSNINIEILNYNELDELENIKDIDKSIINLTIEDTLEALKLLYKCRDINIDSVYVDILNKKEYWFKNGLALLQEELADLYIDDIIKANGNNVISYDCKFNNDRQILDFTKVIYENFSLWNKYKQMLYDTTLFEHDYNNQSLVRINSSKLNNEERDLLFKIISNLESLKLINVFNYSNKQIEVHFLNDYLKAFIFKSGTWLEVLTESVVKEINSIDDVKSGVVFLWNEPIGNIKNELDVVAVKDSLMVIISCKDSCKYDENTLNELKVYSDKLGGENTKKILVATKEPTKSSIFDRAKEMGIYVVILGRDINKFKQQLEYIINKK